MKVVRYEIVTATTVQDLTAKVNDYISDGWQPVGGVCVMEEGVPAFYQAMVKQA